MELPASTVSTRGACRLGIGNQHSIGGGSASVAVVAAGTAAAIAIYTLLPGVI